jgi:hypothetical protein
MEQTTTGVMLKDLNGMPGAHARSEQSLRAGIPRELHQELKKSKKGKSPGKRILEYHNQRWITSVSVFSPVQPGLMPH